MLLICRSLALISKEIYLEEGLVLQFREGKAFLSWHTGRVGRSPLSWAHHFPVAACIFGAGRIFFPQVV